jgi:Spy/CpxP family protein refolding chaperone
VNLHGKIRFSLLLCVAMLFSAAALAQRGGGGMGGPGGGGMGHGGMMEPHDGMGMMRSPNAQAHIHAEPIITLPGRWWDDKKTMRSLNLRPEQQERMDAIFNANKDNLMGLYTNLQREQQRFVQMPREDLQDESKVFAQIDRVAQARADLEKANFHTLIQIRHEMDPEQLAALDKTIADSGL